MKDKSLNVMLMVLFGISGVAILMLAWLQPMPGVERIMTALIGSTGFLVVLIKALHLKSRQDRLSAEPVLVEVKAQDKH